MDGKSECLALITLAKNCVDSAPGFKEQLDGWFKDANKLLKSSKLETLSGEKKLDDLALSLRYLWLLFARSHTDTIFKSPSKSDKFRMPSGYKYKYAYDRWARSEHLEKRCHSYRPPIAGWECDHVMFASGMAAINGVINLIKGKFAKRSPKPMRMYEFGGYFEFKHLFRALNDKAFKGSICQTHEDFIKRVASGKGDILMFEPVSCNWGQEVIDLDAFTKAWRAAAPHRASAIIVDTTITGSRFPMEAFLESLSSDAPDVVVQASSGLKLDQEGLEFAGAGIVSVYTPPGVPRDKLQRYTKRLRKLRRTLALGLPVSELAALEFPAFLNLQSHQRHIDAVFENNALFARSITIGQGILETISHPAMRQDTRSWAVSPFVLFRITGGRKEDKEFLKYVIRHEAGARKLRLDNGTSFGFRSHRFAMGIVDKPGIATFRIAMGSRRGPSLFGLIDLINELAAYPDFVVMRAAYPKLAAKPRAQIRETTPKGAKKPKS